MTTETTAVAVRDEQAVAMAQEMSVEMVLAQTKKIQELMKVALIDGEHYGVIPGTGQKKTLLKPGAEKLCLMFRFSPEYSHQTDREPGGHLTVTSTCRLIHSPSGTLVATGSGMGSTHESKYAYRRAERACPKCGVAAVFKSKKDAGYYCWAKKDGCGAQFQTPEEIASIESQEVGRKANDDLADQWNTVLKMADKRALVAAVLNGTAASDIFTQDLEDLEENLRARKPPANGVDPNSLDVIDMGSRQKPTDPATSQQRKALVDAAHKAAGSAEAGDKWLGEQLHALNRKKWGEVTVADFQLMMTRLAEYVRTEGPQDQPAPEADLHAGDIDFPENADPAPASDESIKRAETIINGTEQRIREQNANAALISDAQGKRLYAIAKGDGPLLKEILGQFGFEHSRDIPKARYDQIVAEVQKAVGQ
jgi:hypothetical protein